MGEDRRRAFPPHLYERPGEATKEPDQRPPNLDGLAIHSALWLEGLSVLLKAHAEVKSERRGERIDLTLRGTSDDLRRITGERGERWRSLNLLLTAIGAAYGVEIHLSIADPPRSTWAFDLPAPVHRLKVTTTLKATEQGEPTG